MKAIQILGERGNRRLTLTSSLPKPIPKADEILIKVHAAGITADEVSWVEVYKTPSRIPGHDISGVIQELGPSYIGPLSVGDAVFAMLDADRGQGMAEYAIASPGEVAPKPGSISHAEAAALPIPVLTAWEALSRHANLAGRQARVLVTGGSGAVGVMAVQLAKVLFDAEVIALASGAKHEYLRQLPSGVSEVVDYNTPGWETEVGEVDAVLDTAGGEVLSKAWAAVKNDGVIVTVADPPPPWAFEKGVVPVELASKPDVRYVYFVVSVNAEALTKVAGFIDEGRVKGLPVVEFPVDEALDAWEYASRRGRPGKTVINFC
ncbi:Reticulon-4-interacting protein 1, mitochondrial [Podospora conica]|nr:Reticulon-4-interacting protein 1, mitochondrial [Schizothecium conicum]